MNKREKRKQIKQMLMDFQGEARQQAEREIYQKIYAHPFWLETEIIATTMSMPFEINTKPIIEKAWEEGKKVAVPVVCTKTGNMVFYEIKDFTHLVKGAMDILEPVKDCNELPLGENVLCIVPGLAFSKEGYRLGFGGGFYDRFLADFSGKTLSLAFHFQQNQSFPISSYDLPVQTIISNEKDV